MTSKVLYYCSIFFYPLTSLVCLKHVYIYFSQERNHFLIDWTRGVLGNGNIWYYSLILEKFNQNPLKMVKNDFGRKTNSGSYIYLQYSGLSQTSFVHKCNNFRYKLKCVKIPIADMTLHLSLPIRSGQTLFKPLFSPPRFSATATSGGSRRRNRRKRGQNKGNRLRNR